MMVGMYNVSDVIYEKKSIYKNLSKYLHFIQKYYSLTFDFFKHSSIFGLYSCVKKFYLTLFFKIVYK